MKCFILKDKKITEVKLGKLFYNLCDSLVLCYVKANNGVIDACC